MIQLRPVTVLLRFIYLGNKYSETVVCLAEWRSHEDVTLRWPLQSLPPPLPWRKAFKYGFGLLGLHAILIPVF